MYDSSTDLRIGDAVEFYGIYTLDAATASATPVPGVVSAFMEAEAEAIAPSFASLPRVHCIGAWGSCCLGHLLLVLGRLLCVHCHFRVRLG